MDPVCILFLKSSVDGTEPLSVPFKDEWCKLRFCVSRKMFRVLRAWYCLSCVSSI